VADEGIDGTAPAEEEATDAGQAEPIAQPAGEEAAPADASKAEPAEPAAPPQSPDRRSRGTRRKVAILGAVTVILGAFGVWATVASGSVGASAAPQNVALTDGAATKAVDRQITSAVNTIFSYNYTDTGVTRQAAQRLLTGPAVRQYDTLFALVARNAPAQKLIVTTRVTNSGVELLTGNRARVLVFANQQDTRAGTGQTSYGGAMFAVTAVRQGGSWKIENIDTFTG